MMGQRNPPHPDDSRSRVQAELAELRARYRRELPQKVQAVKEAARALAGSGSTQELEALHLLAHRLVGSAAIYGLAAVSQAAAALEDFLVHSGEVSPPASATGTQRLQALVAAVEAAAREG